MTVPTLSLHGAGGGRTSGEQWLRPADAVDRRLLARCRGPVLDVGCGPGRHTIALAERGVPTLGVDITATLVALARPRGAVVLHRSVFDPLPGTGRWGTALVLDANLGIGGDLVRLLDRLVALVRPGGLVLAEPAAGPGDGDARVVVGTSTGPWFPWSEVDEGLLVAEVAGRDDLVVRERWSDGGRRFVALERVGPTARGAHDAG